jgi:hypothetical protein
VCEDGLFAVDRGGDRDSGSLGTVYFADVPLYARSAAVGATSHPVRPDSRLPPSVVGLKETTRRALNGGSTSAPTRYFGAAEVR